MAKLYFRFGAMNCGKSTILQQVAHNYEENDKKIIVIKSSIDTKADNKISSRIGIEREVDYLVSPSDSMRDTLSLKGVSCILVDESQFLTEDQVSELFLIAKYMDIPVICYGLKTDSFTNLFPGSKRIVELGDALEEMKTICPCGKAARFNARYDKKTGEYVSEGNQVVIDGNAEFGYRGLCGKCYAEKVGIKIGGTLYKGEAAKEFVKVLNR